MIIATRAVSQGWQQSSQQSTSTPVVMDVDPPIDMEKQSCRSMPVSWVAHLPMAKDWSTNLPKYLGNIKYFANLNSWAIWGWFPNPNRHRPGFRSIREVVMKVTQKVSSRGWPSITLQNPPTFKQEPCSIFRIPWYFWTYAGFYWIVSRSGLYWIISSYQRHILLIWYGIIFKWHKFYEFTTVWNDDIFFGWFLVRWPSFQWPSSHFAGGV